MHHKKIKHETSNILSGNIPYVFLVFLIAVGAPFIGSAGTPVVAPAFNPIGGIYDSVQMVALSSTTAGATIRYTTDGSTPSELTGTVYTAPFKVTATMTVKAVAFVAGLSASAVASATYLIAGPPSVDSVSPVNAFIGTPIKISGRGFGSLQGRGAVWLGTTYGRVLSWSDRRIVAMVAPNSRPGIARVRVAGVWSNSVPFQLTARDDRQVPSSGNQPHIAGATLGSVRPLDTSSVTLSPNVLSMVVGDTHTIQALGTDSQPARGLTWTSSDSNVVSLSTDDPPVLTAVAAGQATITAGDASADITVYTAGLPTGTVIWSNPGNGSGVYGIMPAVPSLSGVADVFAFQGDGTVQAMTSDGATAWTADVSEAWNTLSDFQGGLVLDNWNSIWKLDGTTGQSYPAYTTPDSAYLGSSVVVHPDGTIFAYQTNESDDNSDVSLIGIDPTTGTQKFSILLGASDRPIDLPSCPSEPAPYNLVTGVTNFIVGGDGYAYVAYQSEDWVRDCSIYLPDDYLITTHLKLVRVNSAGAYDTMNIKDWSPNDPWFGPPYSTEFSVNMITNADSGILLSWQLGTMANPQVQPALNRRASAMSPKDMLPDPLSPPEFGMAMIAGTSVSPINGSILPNQATNIQPVLQAQGGSFVGTVGTEDANYMISLDQTGNVLWSVAGDYQPQIATEDGGVIATDLDTGAAVTFDQNGNATGQIGAALTYSWFGNSYQLGSVDQVAANLINVADSFWALAQGNASGNGTANRPLAKTVQQLIAQIARSNVGSQTWLDTPGQNKCNIFVKDVLKQAGLTAPVSPTNPSWRWRAEYLLGLVDTPAYPAQSRDWANPGTDLKCWRPVRDNNNPPALPPDISRPGDVIAEAINYSDAFGHVGIVAGPQQTVSADSAAQCVIGKPAGTIDISDYGFRPNNWVDPLGCGRIYGKKADAGVKRFVCQ